MNSCPFSHINYINHNSDKTIKSDKCPYKCHYNMDNASTITFNINDCTHLKKIHSNSNLNLDLSNCPYFNSEYDSLKNTKTCPITHHLQNKNVCPYLNNLK